MKKWAVLVSLLWAIQIYAQKWVDTTFAITKTTVTYGNDVDFAGNNKSLLMDICVPINDAPPACGRPLLIAIHGGAFMAGSKEDQNIQHWLKDFAKRGYVTAAINYRLGMFQTSSYAHCNVTQLFNTPWDCSNMADTAEWYRGCYRGIQDVKGAIRYLILNKSQFQIDPRNIFLTGESAGGFIALGAAILDTLSDKSATCYGISTANVPNIIYENTCVKMFNWDTSIASMHLIRPDLGSIEGTLNDNAGKYMIKGVGNFFGGMFPGWLENKSYTKPPDIYFFHQPNDIIVPYKSDKVLKGYSDCFQGLGCASLINIPWVHGSAEVRNQIERMKKLSLVVPEYWLDSTTNNADCGTQFSNPSLAGHAIDNYWLRTLHMAQFFAPRIDTSSNCILPIGEIKNQISSVSIFPNPFQDEIYINTENHTVSSIKVSDIAGRTIPFQADTMKNGLLKIQFSDELKQGFYFIQINCKNGLLIVKKTIKTDRS